MEKDLREWVDARAWTTSDGPKAIFDAVRWLRERDVLLPGVTVLARLVAQVREEAYQRLWDTLHGMLTAEQRRLLDSLAVVPEGERFSLLERWRRGPAKASGLNMIKALDRVSQITGTGFGQLDLEPAVPARRLTELARYGMTASATQIRRHPPPRRLATLLSTVVHLESKAIDDALELLDLLMATELLGKAERDSDKDKVRRHPRLARASAKLAAAVEVLFEVTEYGTKITLEQLWEGIEAVTSRRELRDAVEAVTDMVPPPDAADDGQTRALLAARIATVSGFVKILTEVIAFGATADGMQVLAAMKDLPRLLDGRRANNLTAGDIDADLVRGSWTRLMFPGEGRVERNAYVFCVLTQFHAKLKRRDIYAETSTCWRDPRAQLLDGEAWTAAKGTVLTALGLPEDPDALLAVHARLLDDTYRGVAGRLSLNDAVSVDADGRLHVERINAIPEPRSLIDLRKRVNAMLPDQAADAVERHDCPNCIAPAGSPCRTRGGRTAAKYHTARFVLVPALKEDLEVLVPAGRGPGRHWKAGPPAEPAPATGTAAPIRIEYARTSTVRQELASQLEALERAQCRRIFSEKISTRVKFRPELEQALKLARDIKHAAPEQTVTLTVHEMKRVARSAAELMVFSAELQAGDIQLELLTGPLTGIYDPSGMGSMLFAVLAVAAQLDRDYTREKTLEGQQAAAAKGNHGGRPKVFDDDMLLFARALRDQGTPVPGIAKKLTIKTGKNAGKNPSVASVYRALAEAPVEA